MSPTSAAVLNAPQRQAACWGRIEQGRFTSDALLVIAGAGTGKTATLAHRVAHLIAQGVAPERIALLTFSRRAAQEMLHRASLLLGARGEASSRHLLPWAGTFHSVGARLLRQYAPRLGLPADFAVLDRPDSADLLDTLREELGLAAGRNRFPRKDTCLAIYSQRVNTGVSLKQILADLYPWCKEHHDPLANLMRRYVERKQTDGLLDFDDLLLWWDAALQEPTLGAEIASRFDHLLVDEYQDTNRLQAGIVQAMQPQGHGVFVVGDDAQSIYGFRGADVENILGFEQRYQPPATRIVLQTNYRSVQTILDAANALLAESLRQYPKNLVADRPGGRQRPRLVCVLDEREQAQFVADQVLSRRETGVALKSQAVLFRSAQHSAYLELELARRNIPFVKHGGLKFVEAAHIKDLLALLRWAEHPGHRIAAFRCLQLMPGIGPAFARRCAELVLLDGRGFAALRELEAPAASHPHWSGFVDLMGALSDRTTSWHPGLLQAIAWFKPLLAASTDHAGVRADDLDRLASMAQRFPSREQFLTELALDPPQASGDLSGEPLRDEDYLELSTVHSAKGREWQSVYVLNMADGNFPNEYATGSAAGIDEERRLLYVAMTRARLDLDLIEPQRYYVTAQPRWGGDHVFGARSRFLTPSVMACLEVITPSDKLATSAGTDPANTHPAAPSTPATPVNLAATSATPAATIAARLRDAW